MATVSFTVPGNPVPWERVQSKGGQRFTAPRTRAHKQAIQFCAKAAKVKPLDGPVRMAVTFYRESAHPCDIDNLTKSVQDALNGIAYRDDRQIVTLVAVKGIDRENPRTEVEIEPAREAAPLPVAKAIGCCGSEGGGCCSSNTPAGCQYGASVCTHKQCQGGKP